jgi:hypothetical protein
MMELVLCIGNDRHRKMKTRRAIGVAQLLRNTGHFPEKPFDEREKSSRQTSENRMSLAERDPTIAIPKARGLNPCLLGRTRTTRFHVRPSVTLLLNGLSSSDIS